MSIYYILLYFFVYGFFGWCTEVGFAAWKTHHFVNRGFLNGPICPIYGVGVTAVVTLLTPYKSDIIVLYILSVVLVTVLEGVTGWAMDKIFHHKWWDYSDMPLNIGGYVCLLFSLIWGVACVLIMDLIHPFFHKLLTFLPSFVGIALIVILGIILIADLYVTASTIFKFNRRLATMERIASELHEISDQIGQEIFQATIQAIELQESSKDKLDATIERTQNAASELKDKTRSVASEIKERTLDAREHSMEVSDELRNKITELRAKYRDSQINTPHISRRLINAFPKMESRNYKEQLEALKKRWKRS